jgi:hypothetical protein
MRLDSFFLALLFLASFSESLSTIYNYFFVFSGMFLIFYFNKNIIVPINLKMALLFVLIIPAIQFILTGNYAGKWIVNFFFFSIGMIGVITLIARMKYISYIKFRTYLRQAVFLTLSVYIIYPIVDHGLVGIFLVDRNYLYSSANSILPPDFLVKQKMSALVMFYIVIVWQMVKNCNHGLSRLLLCLLLMLALNMLLGSRSQTIGLFIATILVTAGHNINRIRVYSAITASTFLILIFIMASNEFIQLAALDIRVMLFHSAAVSFFDQIFGGIGLFYLPQYLDSNNYLFYSKFSYLYSEYNKSLEFYPTGFESSFMQLSLELGLISIFILYFVVQGLLRAYSLITSDYKFFVFFIISYIFSSLTEDNITQPSIYLIVAILYGLLAYERTHGQCMLVRSKRISPSPTPNKSIILKVS